MLVVIGASLVCCYGAAAETSTAMSRSSTVACTTEPVAEGKTLIAVVGDSITFGFNCHAWEGGYVKVLQDILGTEKYDVRDCGISGMYRVRVRSCRESAHGPLMGCAQPTSLAFC